MPNLNELRLAAREIFDEALRAVDPAAAIKNAVRLESSGLAICDTRFTLPSEANLFGLAIGKAATSMAFALEDVLGYRFVDGVISAPRRASSRWQYFEGGHPLPNAASLKAGKAAFSLLNVANHERALVVFLISGGGSTMLEWPISEDISLEDLRAANQTLVSCGASIGEINAVRRAFSAVKGGRLAASAPNCPQATLIVSDVPRGEEKNVASGPTLSRPNGAPSAADVVASYTLQEKLPASILRAIENPASEIPTAASRQSLVVLLDNDTALQAAANAARTRGFAADIAHEISDDQIEVGCEKLLARFTNSREASAPALCLISGGEFACPVRGNGIGGRNLETALRLAIAAENNRGRIGEFVALCAGTDGVDGNSPAAGALIDRTTIERARSIGFGANDFLKRSDAYSFFEGLGDAITIGPTGTNVRDLRILL